MKLFAGSDANDFTIRRPRTGPSVQVSFIVGHCITLYRGGASQILCRFWDRALLVSVVNEQTNRRCHQATTAAAAAQCRVRTRILH